MRNVEPVSFVLAETKMTDAGREAFLAALGAPKWGLDLDNGAGELVEMAGRFCYRSFEPGLNPNVTKTRKDHKAYIGNILKQGHGSVLEHATTTVGFLNVSRVFTHEIVRHRAGTAFCLAGDAQIWSGARCNGRWDGVKRRWTMRELYEKTLSAHGRSRLKILTVRTFDGDLIVPAKIRRIFKSGVKNVYKIILKNGRSVRASADHLFLGRTKWVRLGDLSAGDEIACNGTHVVPRSDIHRAKISANMMGAKNHRWSGDQASQQAGRLRAYKKFVPDLCARCGAADKLHRHHRDENTLNNDPKNVEFLCATCHQHQHHLGRQLTVCWSEVVAVQPDGAEETFDLEVDHPAHNFVIDGVVTHNSQESLRFVRLDDLSAWFPGDLAALDNDGSIREAFQRAFENAEEACGETFKKLGVDDMSFGDKKKVTSAVRRMVPMGVATGIIVTANHRAWRNIIEQRCTMHAEQEIREVMWHVAADFKERYSSIYQDMELNLNGTVAFEHSKV